MEEIQRPLSSTTQTKTKSITNTKMAVATAFLGFAAVAAGFFGTRGQGVDLIIREVSFESEMYKNKVTLYYQNMGSASVTSPYNISVYLSALPSGISEVTVQHIKPGDYSTSFTEVVAAKNSMTIPVGLYALQPKEYGTIEITYPVYKEGDVTGQLKISAMIDREKNIIESNEKNI